MRYGTSHFISKQAAIRYYSDYGYTDVVSAVERKLAEGEIHIGPPTLKEGQTLIHVDGGLRYGINEP